MIVAGFGYRGDATLDSLHSALRNAAGDVRPGCLATLAHKADLLRRFGADAGVPVSAIEPGALGNIETLTRSAQSLKAHGTASVAEACALAAAGTSARLLGARAISDDRRATCALATGDPE